jgi:hypothetical protein
MDIEIEKAADDASGLFFRADLALDLLNGAVDAFRSWAERSEALAQEADPAVRRAILQAGARAMASIVDKRVKEGSEPTSLEFHFRFHSEKFEDIELENYTELHDRAIRAARGLQQAAEATGRTDLLIEFLAYDGMASALEKRPRKPQGHMPSTPRRIAEAIDASLPNHDKAFRDRLAIRIAAEMGKEISPERIRGLMKPRRAGKK